MQFDFRYPDLFRSMCESVGLSYRRPLSMSEYNAVLSTVLSRHLPPPREVESWTPNTLGPVLVEFARRFVLSEWVADPEGFAYQLRKLHRSKHELLSREFGGEAELVQFIREKLIFHTPDNVARELFELANEEQWSSDPGRFESQFKRRYPDEYEVICKEFVLSDVMESATRPPQEVADNLVEYARWKVIDPDEDLG